MKRGTKILLAFFALFICGMLGGVLLFYVLIFHTDPGIPEDSYLVLRPGGTLPEQPALADPLADVLGSAQGASVIEFDSALRKAAVDDRIAGVIMRIDPLECGIGKVQELRGAIHRYRESCDKPIIAWMEMAGNKEYYLASACSEVYMSPEGMLLFTGVRFAVTFFKGTLDKLGVEAEFVRVGQYKSAVEPYTREGMSESMSLVLNSMADDIFGQMTADIAQDRDMTLEELTGIVDDPPLTARGSLAVGLIDGVIYRDELEQQLKPAGEETWSLVGLDTYSTVSPSSLGLGGGPQVAVIYCEGAIMSGESAPPYWGGDPTMGSATISDAIRQAREDTDIEAVVLRINSPGGSGLASDVIWREVVLTREEKPVVVSMSDYAASGGYYIAMAADAIVAQPGTLTGSIGVYSGKFSMAGLYEMVGLSVETIERGAYADLLTSARPFTEEERGKMEQMVEEFYFSFITKAAEGRGREDSEIDRLAQGRVWTGMQAHEVGLVDQLGGFRTALQVAKELSGIDADEEVSLVVLPEQRTMFEEFFGGPSASFKPSSRSTVGTAIPAIDRSLQQFLAVAPLLSSGAPLAMMPFHIEVE